MIERSLKRAIGRMTYGAYVVACRSDDLVRAYTSTWTYQLSFEEPVVAISVSPKHDTYELIEAERWFSVSILAGDQIEPAQYFSYPGRRFRYLGDYMDEIDGIPVVRDCIAWLRVDVSSRIEVADHVVFIGVVDRVGEGRIDEPALTYSSRRGWRVADTSARSPGVSVRDRLLRMLEEEPGPGGASDG